MSSHNSDVLSTIKKQIWDGALPVEIRLSPTDCTAYADSDPYHIALPRLSYLSPLLPRLHAFFLPHLIDPTTPSHESWLSFDSLPLKWHYPVGLLYDLFSGAPPSGLDSSPTLPKTADAESTLPTSDATAQAPHLPWRLTLHYTAYPSSLLFPLDAGTSNAVLRDAFVNAVKEADFLRTGSAKNVMGLSKADVEALFASAVTERDRERFEGVNARLLNPAGMARRGWAVKVYLPVRTDADAATAATGDGEGEAGGGAASVRVVQGFVAKGGQGAMGGVTLGTVLNELLPTVFTSRRNPVLACPVLHGAVVPMTAGLDELSRTASYTDGFLHICAHLLS